MTRFFGGIGSKLQADAGVEMGPACSSSPFKTTAHSDIGSAREFNEDQFLDVADHGVWAVVDGMGGHSHGARAAQTVVDALAGAAISDKDEDLSTALHGANSALFADTPSGHVTGATVAVLKIAGERYRCFWAGDCRVFQLRSGSIRQLTVDHTEVQEMISAGIIESKDAERHPRRHVVTRAVGVHPTVELDCTAGSAHAGDVFVLCSDGLTLTSCELERELRREAHSPNCAERLVQRALGKGSRDNVTAVVVTLVG